MPKKSKKSAEAEAAAPSTELLTGAQPEAAETAVPASQEETAPPDVAGTRRKIAAKKTVAKKSPAKKSAAKKKSARQPITPAADEGPASAADAEAKAEAAEVEADVAAQAAMVKEDALEANDPSEVLTPETELPVAAAEPATGDEEDSHYDEAAGFEPQPRQPAKLERLQKILAQAGIASRRHAEELITQGRVQVNGQVVTTLGSKADPSRDHIRVDGKLLHGAERLRYFMLNKPRGYVTTVSDPEGRPTVMEFFKKAGERLYPVGRLDYLSEGLLLVTNDGELANKLTRAASGVEKTYLVKVSGQPSEAEIGSLREGVRIDRAKPGEGSVQTAPARIRQVRIGENPWYEVVLIEGRNRELRKMFEEIGHFVEKIRRVGYGPLVLDLEPGQVRELDDQEKNLLRLAAEGKWKPKKIKTSAMLPREAGRTVDAEARKRGSKPFRPPSTGLRRGDDKPFRPAQSQTPQSRKDDRRRPEGRPSGATPSGTNQARPRPGFKDRSFAPRGGDQGQWRDAGRSSGRPPAGGDRRPFSKPPADRGEGRSFAKPPNNRGEGRGFAKPPAGRGGERRSFSRPPASASGSAQRPFRDRPGTGGADKPRFERPAFPARPRRPGENSGGDAGFGERKPFKPRPNRPLDRPGGGQGADRRFGQKPGKPAGRPFAVDRGRPPRDAGRSFGPRPEGRTGEKPAFPPRRDGTTPSRPTARPPAGNRGAFTSSGIPRPGGARPSSSGPGRTGFQGRGRTGGGAQTGGGRSSGPRPGSNGSSRPGFKSKPGGRGGKPGGGGSGRKRG